MRIHHCLERFRSAYSLRVGAWHLVKTSRHHRSSISTRLSARKCLQVMGVCVVLLFSFWLLFYFRLFTFAANMFDLRVGGVSLGVSITRLTIVDSGTTLGTDLRIRSQISLSDHWCRSLDPVTLPESAYNALVNRMNQVCRGSACDLFAPTDFFLPASLEDIVLLPSISFVFDRYDGVVFFFFFFLFFLTLLKCCSHSWSLGISLSSGRQSRLVVLLDRSNNRDSNHWQPSDEGNVTSSSHFFLKHHLLVL